MKGERVNTKRLLYLYRLGKMFDRQLHHSITVESIQLRYIPSILYLWHRFSRVIFIYFCQDLPHLMNKLQVLQTVIRSKNTFSYPAFNFSNLEIKEKHTQIQHYNNNNKIHNVTL
jgi:hypothetical protein